MPLLLIIYLARRIALTALLIETTLCVPLVMTSLFQSLPAAAVRGGLLGPALLGTMPTVLYLALPMAVGVAVALEFSRMSADGMIAVLYSLRLSVWSLCAPALVVAAVAVGAGYWLSSWFAPTYVGQMHDVLYVIRNSLNHRMLEPAHFYTFDKGARTLYFQRWRSADVATGMFIHQFSAAKNEEQIINASEAEFRPNEQGVVIVLSNGSIETIPRGGAALRTANFDRYVIPVDMQGSGALPKRGWRGMFELPMGEFFAARPIAEWNPDGYADWMSEATKRCCIPLLALSHGLLAIGLVLTASAATGRASAATTSAILVIPLIHVAIVVGAESLVQLNPRLVIIVGVAILVEFAAALFLIWRQNANFPKIEAFAEDPAASQLELPA
jgi:lipopolysaccharide export system permease protein